MASEHSDDDDEDEEEAGEQEEELNLDPNVASEDATDEHEEEDSHSNCQMNARMKVEKQLSSSIEIAVLWYTVGQLLNES